MSPHTRLLNAILTSAPPKVRLFRNDQGYVESVKGHHITYGLLPGSGDLIGWTSIRGQAIFTSVEVKAGKDRVRPKQADWVQSVLAAGGIAIVCRSVEEFLAQHGIQERSFSNGIAGASPFGVLRNM